MSDTQSMVSVFFSLCLSLGAFSALTLLVGWQEGHGVMVQYMPYLNSYVFGFFAALLKAYHFQVFV